MKRTCTLCITLQEKSICRNAKHYSGICISLWVVSSRCGLFGAISLGYHILLFDTVVDLSIPYAPNATFGKTKIYGIRSCHWPRQEPFSHLKNPRNCSDWLQNLAPCVHHTAVRIKSARTKFSDEPYSPPK